VYKRQVLLSYFRYRNEGKKDMTDYIKPRKVTKNG